MNETPLPAASIEQPADVGGRFGQRRCRRIRVGALRIDRPAALLDERVVEQPLDRRVDERRIPEVVLPVGDGEFDRLGVQVHEVGAAVAVALERKAFEQLRRFEYDHALRDQWLLEDVVAAVPHAQRIFPLWFVRCQIVRAQKAAAGAHVGVERAREGAIVERPGAAAGDRFERRGESG